MHVTCALKNKLLSLDDEKEAKECEIMCEEHMPKDADNKEKTISKSNNVGYDDDNEDQFIAETSQSDLESSDNEKSDDRIDKNAFTTQATKTNLMPPPIVSNNPQIKTSIELLRKQEMDFKIPPDEPKVYRVRGSVSKRKNLSDVFNNYFKVI